MSDIPISGTNGESLDAAATDTRHIMESPTGGAPDFDGDGRVLELLHLVVRNSHAASQALFRMYDDDEISGPAGSGNTRIGPTYIIPPNSVMEKTWPKGTGPSFNTNIVAETVGGAGTIAADDVYTAGVLH